MGEDGVFVFRERWRNVCDSRFCGSEQTPGSRRQNMLCLSKSPDDHLLSLSGSSLTEPLSSPAAHRTAITDSHSHTSVHSLVLQPQTWIEGLFVFSTVTCNDRHSELLLTENYSQDKGLGGQPPPKPPLPPCSASSTHKQWLVNSNTCVCRKLCIHWYLVWILLFLPDLLFLALWTLPIRTFSQSGALRAAEGKPSRSFLPFSWAPSPSSANQRPKVLEADQIPGNKTKIKIYKHYQRNCLSSSCWILGHALIIGRVKSTEQLKVSQGLSCR